MSFPIPSLQAILDRARRELRTRLALTSIPPKGPIDAIAGQLAVLERSALEYARWEALQLLPHTATAPERLDGWGVLLNSPRKAATYATGTVAFINSTNGVVVPAGTTFTRDDGTKYDSIASATVVAGTATIPLRAQTAGVASDATTGTKLTIASAIAGLASTGLVTAPGISGGADQETDDEYRSRLVAAFQSAPKTGTVHDYVRWALEVPGVTRAWAIENNQGAGTVGVTFVQDDDPVDIVPTANEVAAVQAYLDDRRPAGIEVVAFAPTKISVPFTLHVVPDTAEVRSAVTSALADMLERSGGPSTTIPLSQVHEAVSLAQGEYDHALTVPSADLVFAAGQVPVLGTVTFV